MNVQNIFRKNEALKGWIIKNVNWDESINTP